jgi:hypothetical protein
MWDGMSAANETYDVFVSYSRADSRHAVEIDSVLRAKGLRSFFDRRVLACPGLEAGKGDRFGQSGDRADRTRRARQYPAIRTRTRHYSPEPRAGVPDHTGDPA